MQSITMVSHGAGFLRPLTRLCLEERGAHDRQRALDEGPEWVEAPSPLSIRSPPSSRPFLHPPTLEHTTKTNGTQLSKAPCIPPRPRPSSSSSTKQTFP